MRKIASTTKPTALVMCLADPSASGRPNRAISLLRKAGFLVDTLSYPGEENLSGGAVYELSPPRTGAVARIGRILNSLVGQAFCRIRPSSFVISRFNEMRYGLKDVRRELEGHSWSLILVEDLQLLPLADDLKGRASLVFDAREYYPKQNEEKRSFRWLEAPQRIWLCERYLPLCDKVITVSTGLAKAYEERFGIAVEVLRSVPPYQTFKVRSIQSSPFRMVHHGVANPNRGLENMIEIVKRLDERFTLDFYLVGRNKVVNDLKRLAKGCERINFLEPVPFGEIISMLNQYDIGFYYLEPRGFNVTYNLPNKFFEFIQARLAIAIGPSAEMAEIVQKYGCGFVADEFSIQSMVKALGRLNSEDINKAKSFSAKAAKELSFEYESKNFASYLKSIATDSG